MSYPYQHSTLAVPEDPSVRSKPPPENKPSHLLSPDENRLIFGILGKGTQTLATAVGRILVPTLDHQQWQVRDSTGAVCLVRDTTKKSYFIQMLSLRTRNTIFEQEIYNQFEYQMPQATFMTFEGDSSMIAILFADMTEASNFRQALDGKLEAKRLRRSVRESKKYRVLEPQVNNTPPTTQSYVDNQTNYYPPSKNVNITTAAAPSSQKQKPSKSKGKEKANKKKPKLTAGDIGTPMNFRHVQHVGWDPEKGFDMNLEDKDLRTLFEKAGVSANHLKDENTRKFIYNFIEQHKPPPPTPPSRAVHSRPPPQPPVHAGTSAAAGPPPPPPIRSIPNAVHNSQNQHRQHGVVNSPSQPQVPKRPAVNGNSTAAPPPPPPMPVAVAPPPPPPPPPPVPDHVDGMPESNGSTSSAPDDRSQLMKQIQLGVQLKKVEADTQPKRPGGGIASYLSEIQKGVDLKPVPESAKAQPSHDAMDGLAGALARALVERQKALNPDSSSSDDEDGDEYDEEEWE